MSIAPPVWLVGMDVHPFPTWGQTYPEEGIQGAIFHVLSHNHCQAAWAGKGDEGVVCGWPGLRIRDRNIRPLRTQVSLQGPTGVLSSEHSGVI